jgi:hypothetical protein
MAAALLGCLLLAARLLVPGGEDAVQRARAACREMAARARWSAEEVTTLAAAMLVDPARFAAEPAFRRQVLDLLPRELDPAAPPRLRDDLLTVLNHVPAFDFDAAEATAAAWGALPRRSAERLRPYGREGLRFDDDAATPIAASVLSLPAAFFDDTAAVAFLSALHALVPERDLLVLTDGPLRQRLAECCGGPRVHLLETFGRPFSPWARDPLSLVRAADGSVVVLARPNAQRGREEDLHLAAALVQQLPAAVDRGWGGVRWEVAPVPFHNGQVLLTRDAAWISLHALEPRILGLLGVDRVPVESFGGASGIERYFAAARTAATELARLYGRPVRFVHPLPPEAIGGSPAAVDAAAELVRGIGGGAGYDLDSLLTLLPAPIGSGGRAAGGGESAVKPAALVASVGAGRELLAGATAGDWGALRRGYGLADLDAPTGLARLRAAQDTAGAVRLEGFLDLMAAHLEAQGFRIERLPLLSVPVALLADAAGVGGDEFLLTWNNVVLEVRGGRLHAEGFSSLLPAGDRAAERRFAAAGCQLDLLPALVHSIVLNGGYRCASNHLRRAAAGAATRGGR